MSPPSCYANVGGDVMWKIWAKQLLAFLLQLLWRNAFTLLLCMLLFVFYCPIISASAAWILVAVLIVYTNAMAASIYAREKRTRLQRSDALSARLLIGLSTLSCTPLYACWTLLSLLPLPPFGWLVVHLPLVMISGVLLYGVAYNWSRAARCLWWGLQLAIYPASALLGQLLGRWIFA